MKKILFSVNPNITQDLDGFSYIENFLISTVTTILSVRFFLKLTGFPQIGQGGIHIAHMLWGGLLMAISILLILMFLDKAVKNFSSVLAGIGFGLFIDELGKFITSDNNYFYEPTIALIYLLLLTMFFSLQFVWSKMKISQQEYLANALSIIREMAVHGIDETEKKILEQDLKKAGLKYRSSQILKLLLVNLFTRVKKESKIDQIKHSALNFLDNILQNRKVQILLIVIIEIKALINLVIILLLMLVLGKKIPIDPVTLSNFKLDFLQIGQIISSFAETVLAIAAAIFFPFSKYKSFTILKYSLIISIFAVQFFNFWSDQFAALGGLFIAVLALQIVNRILKRYHN